MSGLRESQVVVNGERCRIWEQCEGEPIFFLAGFGGMPRFAPVLARLARGRRVVVPSLPGFPGGARGHLALDDSVDWIAATLDLLEAAGLGCGDLVGASLGGLLAAEVAALARPRVRRLALLAPLGLYDVSDPVKSVFEALPHEVPALLCAVPERYAEHVAPLAGADALEAQVESVRAGEAAARLLWPLGDRGTAKRLHRISAPTLLLWGREDALVPVSYARRFAERIAGPTRTVELSGAGHLAYLDQPEAVAERLLEFFGAPA